MSHLDASDDVLFLQEGLARVSLHSNNGRLVIYRDLQPGDIIGDLSALDGQPRSADVLALADCLVVGLSCDGFRKLLSECPQAMFEQLQRLSALVRDLTNRQLELSTLPLKNSALCLLVAELGKCRRR